jgi:hypothetical protein
MGLEPPHPASWGYGGLLPTYAPTMLSACLPAKGQDEIETREREARPEVTHTTRDRDFLPERGFGVTNFPVGFDGTPSSNYATCNRTLSDGRSNRQANVREPNAIMGFFATSPFRGSALDGAPQKATCLGCDVFGTPGTVGKRSKEKPCLD